jgi:hypothetical protein
MSFRPILSSLPPTSENPTHLYRSAPNHSEQLFYNEKPLLFAQNYVTYLKFPQDHNFLPNQKQLLRELWSRCYYGKDYVGAIMVCS